MTLPLKTYYTIDEAVNLFHQLYPQRVDIDESYFFQLAAKGYINLGIFHNEHSSENNTNEGTLEFDFYDESEDSKLPIGYINAIRDSLMAFQLNAVILILNQHDVFDLYLKNQKKLSNLGFDNLFSLEIYDFSIKKNTDNDLFYFKYTDKLILPDIYEVVYYSESRGEIYYPTNKNHYMPPHINDGFKKDWQSGLWFKKSLDSFTNEEKFSDRIIKKEECLILGEDLQLLKDGKHRESIKIDQKNQEKTAINLAKIQNKIHPKRRNSINKIVYALAKMADLDLSQHQSAYTQLEAFCTQQNIDIPGKDTSGNLFKEIHKAFNSKNSI